MINDTQKLIKDYNIKVKTTKVNLMIMYQQWINT